MRCFKSCIHSLLLLSPSMLVVISCFRLEMQVQEIIISPNAAWFNCTAKNLDEKDSIESIRWLKDDEEFYVYNAVDGRSSQKTMSGKGILDVDDRSSNGSLYIPRTDVNTTGCYKCRIRLTDGRHRDHEKKSITIYLPVGKGFPFIEVFPKAPEDFDTYFSNVVVIASMGQTIGVNCTSRPSNPAAKMGIKINGIMQNDSIKDDEWVDSFFEPIDGTTYHNKLYISHLRATFKATKQMVDERFIRVACSSTLTSYHGFLDQEDSDSIRVRVVQDVKPVVRKIVERESKNFMIFYSFCGVTGALLVMNWIFQNKLEKAEAKKQRLRHLDDNNSFNVSASFANKESSSSSIPMHHRTPEMQTRSPTPNTNNNNNNLTVN